MFSKVPLNGRDSGEEKCGDKTAEEEQDPPYLKIWGWNYTTDTRSELSVPRSRHQEDGIVTCCSVDPAGLIP
jgi:hypothetical protein